MNSLFDIEASSRWDLRIFQLSTLGSKVRSFMIFMIFMIFMEVRRVRRMRRSVQLERLATLAALAANKPGCAACEVLSETSGKDKDHTRWDSDHLLRLVTQMRLKDAGKWGLVRSDRANQKHLLMQTNKNPERCEEIRLCRFFDGSSVCQCLPAMPATSNALFSEFKRWRSLEGDLLWN
jgi:hypothetical protein